LCAILSSTLIVLKSLIFQSLTCDSRHSIQLITNINIEQNYLIHKADSIWYGDIYIYIFIYLLFIYLFICNCVDTRWQQYSTHLPTNSTHNTQNRTYITIRKLKTYNNKILIIWEVRAAPRLFELYPDICLRTEEKHGKTSVKVAARTTQADTVKYKNNEQ
jgi:hypothetical protein